MKKYLDLKWLSLFLLQGLLFVFICLKNQASIHNHELKELGERLITIQTQLKQPVEQPDFSPITQNLNQMGEFIQQLQNKDDHQLGELFTTEQIAIKNNSIALSTCCVIWMIRNSLSKCFRQASYPFNVLSIDSIQEVSVASISYHYKTQALEKGDSLAGWKVFEIDFAKQTIEFENVEKHMFWFA